MCFHKILRRRHGNIGPGAPAADRAVGHGRGTARTRWKGKRRHLRSNEG